MKRALLLLGLLLLLFYVRQPKVQEPSTFEGVAMTVPYRIIVAEALDDLDRRSIEEAIGRVFSKTHSLFNKWNMHSELSHINQAEAGIAIPLSADLEKLLKVVDEAFRLTEGRFDPTVESAQKVWRASLERGELPQTGDFNVGWDKIALGQGTLTKKEDGLEIDLGGIAKGYALDLLLEELQALSHPHLLIEWGGDFVASGHRLDGKPWNIGIRSPDSEEIVECIELNNGSCATSGDYMQSWQVGDRRYFHIFDPKTKAPLEVSQNSIGSVTVKHTSGAMADAFATALMLFPDHDLAQEWLKSHPEGPEQAWLISHQGI